MEKRLVSDRALTPLVAQFVPLKVDVSTADWKQLARRYPVPGNTIPIVYVIRADGEKIFAGRSALSGGELPRMLRAARRQSGGTLNGDQYKLVQQAVQTGQEALARGDVAGSVRAVRPLSKLGPLGELPSYAQPVRQANALVQKIVRRGHVELAAAQKQLAQKEHAPAGALALVTAERTYGAFPELKKLLVAEVRKASRDAQQKSLLVQAKAIDKARLRASVRGGRKQAISDLTSLAIRYRDGPAEATVLEVLRELAGKDYVVPSLQAGAYRSWQDASGKFRVVARLIGVTGSKVELERKDGQKVTVPLTRLSAIDRALLETRKE